MKDREEAWIQRMQFRRKEPTAKVWSFGRDHKSYGRDSQDQATTPQRADKCFMMSNRGTNVLFCNISI